MNARDNDRYKPLDFLLPDWAPINYNFALRLVSDGARVDENLVTHYGPEKVFERIRKAIRQGSGGIHATAAIAFVREAE